MRAAKSTDSHNNNKLVSFSMKITPKEKKKILALSVKAKKPDSRAIMELVNKAVSVSPKRADLRKLSQSERSQILRKQAALAAKNYEVIEDGFDIVEH
jgi:acyl-CoA reductase-like NAD-dependent aldehyde dehydrogenase